MSAVSSSGGATIDVTVGPLSGEGTVRLDVNASGTGIADAAGHALAAGFTTGQIYTRLLAGDSTWISDTNGLWSDNSKWQDGIIGSGDARTATFATLELIADTTVTLDTPRTIGNLIFGDTDIASAASWIVDNQGNALNTLTLANASASPTITVAPLGLDASVTLAASLAGTNGLTKLGPGPLVLTKPNTIAGTLNVNGGLFRLDPSATFNAGAGAVNVGVTAGAQIVVNGGTLAANGLATLGGGGQPGLLTVQSGSAAFGQVRTNSDFGSTYRVNGGSFSATDVNIRRNSAAAVDFNSGFIVNGGVATVGTIGLGTQNSNGAMTVSGGSLTATGAVTVGNQATGGRGGAMRVIGGAFASTDTANGIVLARTNGTNANNVASATFTGGVSTAEKITLGFDATVTAGSATVTINGGALYLGAGGIVKNGAAGLATTLNFSSGVLGAKADWSTSLPITLQPAVAPATLFTFNASDAANQPRAIVLNGVLSGTGGFVKTGRRHAATDRREYVHRRRGDRRWPAAGRRNDRRGRGGAGRGGEWPRRARRHWSDRARHRAEQQRPDRARTRGAGRRFATAASPAEHADRVVAAVAWRRPSRVRSRGRSSSRAHRPAHTRRWQHHSTSLLSTSAPLPVGAAISLASYSGTNFVADRDYFHWTGWLSRRVPRGADGAAVPDHRSGADGGVHALGVYGRVAGRAARGGR